MRRHLPFLIVAIIAFSLVLILHSAFPNYTGFLRVFFFILLIDLYLWFSLIRGFQKTSNRKFGTNFFLKGNGNLRYEAILLYWFPFLLLFSSIVAGFIVPFAKWYQPLRTQVVNLILILYFSKLLPFLSLLFADFVRLIRFLISFRFQEGIFSRPFKMIPKIKPLLIAGWISGGILFLILTYGILVGNYRFTIKEQTIPVADLPDSFDGLQIVQISDLHLGSWSCPAKLEKAVGIINGLKPDMVLFTGDLFNYCTEDGKGFEPILSGLYAPLGVFAVMGNHDYGDYLKWPSKQAKQANLTEAHNYFNKIGWTLLLNANELVRIGADSIAIIGVENWGATRRFRRMGNLEQALHGVEQVPAQLLLSHDPTHWDSIVSRCYPSIDITFSGHTHGGQVGIDFTGIKWSPSRWLYKEWSGLYMRENPQGVQYLYVNQGLGSVGYGGRVGISPEITLITLRKH